MNDWSTSWHRFWYVKIALDLLKPELCHVLHWPVDAEFICFPIRFDVAVAIKPNVDMQGQPDWELVLVYRFPHSAFAILDPIVDCTSTFCTSIEISVLDQDIKHPVCKEQLKKCQSRCLEPFRKTELKWAIFLIGDSTELGVKWHNCTAFDLGVQ